MQQKSKHKGKKKDVAPVSAKLAWLVSLLGTSEADS
jgi:hypothetical protein